MKYAGLTSGEIKSYALIFDIGDDVPAEIIRFAKEQKVMAARLTGIGGFSQATLGYFVRDRKEYEPIAIDEQVELLSLVGDVAWSGEEPLLHAHAVVGHRGGSVSGGHLIAARVFPTLELFVDVYDYELRKTNRPEIGIATISL